MNSVATSQHPSVFQYESAKHFLQDWLTQKQSADRKYSVRRWADDVKLSHSLLIMILQGKRALKLKHVPFFSGALKLSQSERLYFQALVELNDARSMEEKSLLSTWLKDLNPDGHARFTEVQEFEVISSWIHMAILACCELEGFDGSSKFIQKKLARHASLNEVQSALLRLESVGLIQKSPSGKWEATYAHVVTRNDVSSEAVKKYHCEISELAKQAVMTQSLDEREFQSFTVGVHPDQIPMLKEMIRKFRTQVVQALSERPGSDVYNVNLQLFRLTESPAQKPEDAGVDTEKNKHKTGEIKYV